MITWLLIPLFAVANQPYEEIDSSQYYFDTAKKEITSNPSLALEHLAQSKKIAAEKGNVTGVGKAYFLSGYVFQAQDDQYNALKNYYDALVNFKEAKDKKRESDVLYNMGIVFFESYAYDKSVDAYLKSALLKTTIGEDKLIAQLYRNIGMALRYQEQYDSSLLFHEKSLAYYNEEEDNEHFSLTLNDIGIALKCKKDYDAALSNFNKSIEVLNPEADYYQERYFQAVSNIGEVYIEKNNLSKAKEYLHIAYEIAAESDYDHWTELRVLNNIGRIYIQSHDYDSAIMFFSKVTDLASAGFTNTEDEEYLFAHESLVLIYDSIGNKEKLIEHLRILSEHNKFLREKVNKLDKLQKQYEVQMAMYEIQEKENAKKIAAEKREKIEIGVISAISIVAFLIVVMLIIKEYRKSTRTYEQSLTEYQIDLIEKENNLKQHRDREEKLVHWLENW